MEIRKAAWEDLGEIARLYDTLNDYLESHVNYPGWKKGIYPTEEDARKGIEENALFVAVEQGQIAGTFILRHTPEAAYAQVDWNCRLEDDQVWVLYTFAVHLDFRHRGIGRGILRFIDRYAAETGAKAIRLDVYEKNSPAIALYESMGYRYIGTVDLGYSAYGLDWFRLYQKIL